MAGKEAEERWKELVGFVAQVAPCYPVETKAFPDHLRTLLLNPHSQLSAETRKALVQSLVLLRNRGVLGGVDLLKILFPLVSSSTSASMRTYLVAMIQADLKRANAKTKNHKLNRLVQGLLFDMIERSIEAAASGTSIKGKGKATTTTVTSGSARDAMLAVSLASNLWRRGVWKDTKTVALVAAACLHPDTKVQSAAIHFFLAPPGSEGAQDDTDDDDGEVPSLGALQHAQKVGKSRRSHDRKLDQVKKKRKRAEKGAKEESSASNFAALHLLNDPQGFVERLYTSLAQNDKLWTIEHRVLLMRLIARLAGLHRLDVSGFYGYVTKFLTPHQLNITSILLSVAEATHEMTAPDILEPVVRKVAHEFVHPGVANEVVAAGINAITEICRRQHAVMGADLLSDLTEYRKTKDKGVMVAARALLQLFRDVNPALLRRRERGKAASTGQTGVQTALFGQDRGAAIGIDGLELLADHMAKRIDIDDEEEIDGWEAASDTSINSGGWIDVNSDSGSDIYVSDSDDDDDDQTPDVKRARTASVAAESAASSNGPLTSLATEQILTPADFATLDDLRAKAAEEAGKSGSATARRKLLDLKAAKKAAERDAAGGFLDESDIVGIQKRAKSTYEERLASIAEGRKDREKYGSRKGKHRDNKTSTTNKEKAKGKNFLMMAHSNSVRGKKYASLSEKQKKLRKHTLAQKGLKR